ncbi:MAG: hypothetical protein VR69_00610 [Peptococcaceae bacterium BRH_c4b]|nr:MAG: hypothetical protein VR69_00610 [Peptococcaceae bacterium BRH_c4b]
MKTYTFDKFINRQNKNKNIKQQLKIKANNTVCPGKKRNTRRHEETVLLVQSMMKDIKRLEDEGILRKNGRAWKLNI